MGIRFIATWLLGLLLLSPVSAQWEEGAVYREYIWVTPEENESFLRVGGRMGYQANHGTFPASLQDGNDLLLPVPDLWGAIRAEVVLEKVMSHEDSRDLKLVVNGHPPISVPEPAAIPEPQTEYMYHTDIMVPLPLEFLDGEDSIRFQLSLDTVQRWGWPQNLFYAITFRIYYEEETPAVSIVAGEKISSRSFVGLSDVPPEAQQVDYIFIGRDVDWSGRGEQMRKHWQTHRGLPHRIIGSSRDAAHNFLTEWNTEWLPDQPEPFAIQARWLGEDGKYRVVAPKEGLTLAPRPYSVKLYAPEAAPRNWVTRSGSFSQDILVPDEISGGEAYRLHWVSWSPCYGNGLFLNDHLLWTRTEACYVYVCHDPEFSGLANKFLQRGKNTFRTALTPLYGGQMVHGMEVQWPGIQLKVRYGKGAAANEH
ncbi:hypothetical protein [Lewinella sp. W8]|uniref:hypothetical protein n=1 Tax=Lewinella sp. W8 TaxID=2528208 RepID=UPI0010673FC0|nr:hypothetical protein [Lewinella sp. W8]MTB53153.1 hypothetical protein [Lewinella sp. W8]